MSFLTGSNTFGPYSYSVGPASLPPKNWSLGGLTGPIGHPGPTGPIGMPGPAGCDYEELDKVGALIKENLDDVFRNRRSSLYVLPSISRQALTIAQKLGCWIAGGAALALYTGETDKIKDWDLFFKSERFLQDAKAEFLKEGFVETGLSEWSTSLEKAGVIVQLVNRHYYNTIEDIFRKFDFTICCFAIHNNDIYYTSIAKTDLAKKEFNFIYTENLPTCIKRIARYGAKGYIPSTQFAQDIAKTFKHTTTTKLKRMKSSGQS